MEKIEIYTDGSCRKNPGPGGFGVICFNENKIIQGTVRMPRQMHETLVQMAAKREISVNALMCIILKNYLCLR